MELIDAFSEQQKRLSTTEYGIYQIKTLDHLPNVVVY